MKVFKFGGASVKDAAAVKNVAEIVKTQGGDKLIVVVSAMGKTTNALETIIAKYRDEKDFKDELLELKRFHKQVVEELFGALHQGINKALTNLFQELDNQLAKAKTDVFEYDYDQIIGFGELLSAQILKHYLLEDGIDASFLDARKTIRTNHNYKSAEVDWQQTTHLLHRAIENKPNRVYVLQGFVGHTPENQSTSLGREGSDFTAAIAAYCLGAESVTIWKDVPGMLNADPKWFDDTIRIPKLSYKEAVELSYYGATIIHPKTVKPLQNKNIPLYVKSFMNATAEGTVIQADSAEDGLIPSFIFKINQVLISIHPLDFSFIVEENLRDIFDVFAGHGIKINLMQMSALSFSVCIDEDYKLPALLKDLQQHYKILYNTKQELVTIRHYKQETIDRVVVNKKIMLEQRTRQTIRIVMQDLA